MLSAKMTPENFLPRQLSKVLSFIFRRYVTVAFRCASQSRVRRKLWNALRVGREEPQNVRGVSKATDRHKLLKFLAWKPFA